MIDFPSWLDTAEDLSMQGLALAIDAGYCAALVAVVVLILNVCCRRWLGPTALSLLWALVFVRLLLPLAPESSFSLQNLLADASAEESPPAANFRADALLYEMATAHESGAYSASDTDDLSVADDSWFELVTQTLPWLWLAGGMLVIAQTFIVNYRFSRQVNRAPLCLNARVANLWQECCARAGVRRTIAIVLFDDVRQPAMMGITNPRLLLPSDLVELSDDELRMIMLHELAHIRRRDMAINWLLVFVRAAHWWNPVFWLSAARFNTLREQACDAFVMRRLDEPRPRQYGELLLALAGRASERVGWRLALPPSIMGFIPSALRKRAISNRLRSLGQANRTGRHLSAAIATIAIALVAWCGLTDAKTQSPEAATSFDWLPPASVELAAHATAEARSESGPLTTRSYAMQRALARIAESRSPEDAQKELDLHVACVLGNFSRRAARPQAAAAAPVAVDFGKVGELRAGESYGHRWEGTQLYVTAPAEVHAELSRLCEAWEQSGLAEVEIEARFLSTDHDVAVRGGAGWHYFEAAAPASLAMPGVESNLGGAAVRAAAYVDKYLPVVSATLTPEQVAALLDAEMGHRRSNVLQAPRVRCQNGMSAQVSDISQTPFVVGIREADRGAFSPKIDVVDSGTKMLLQPLVSADGHSVRLAARIELASVGEVRTASTVMAGQHATIQMPQVNRCRIDVAAQVEDGHSLLIGCVPSDREKAFFYALFTVRRVSEAAAAP